MGAKLKFKIHNTKYVFSIFWAISWGDPNHMTVQKLWYSIYYYPFTARCVCYVTHSLNPGVQNLCQIVGAISIAATLLKYGNFENSLYPL